MLLVQPVLNVLITIMCGIGVKMPVFLTCVLLLIALNVKLTPHNANNATTIQFHTSQLEVAQLQILPTASQ